MNKISIKKEAYLGILNSSLFYASILIFAITLIAFFSFRSAHINFINKEIRSISNSISHELIEENYPALIKLIQQKTTLQEILIFDHKCNLLSATTLQNKLVCEKNIDGYYSIKSSINFKQLVFFYKLNFNFKVFLKGNLTIGLILFLGIFIVTIFILFNFYITSFIRPIEQIKESIQNGANENLPLEFNFVGSKILELKNEIESAEKDKIQLETAKRVIHDIRNPLLYLQIMSNENELDRSELMNRINEIEYHISSLVKTASVTSNSFNIPLLLANVQNEVWHLFKANLFISNSIESTELLIHPYDLKNIFLNLARNSWEASAINMSITTKQTHEFLEIAFRDDGHGIESVNLDKIFTPKFTTKKHGNGIGLSSISHFLHSKGGSVKLDCSSNRGTQFTLRIPVKKRSRCDEMIFIDNDKFIQLAWKLSANKAGAQLHTFSTVNDFLSSCESFDCNIPIYIDSDLGLGLKGEVLSSSISEKGFKNIFLATSFTDINLLNYPWIKSLVPKQPPFAI